MIWLEWMDIASAVVRLSANIAIPVVAAMASYNWHKAKPEKAIYLLGWAIFLKLISGN